MGLTLRSDLLMAGYSDGELRRMRRAGELTTVRRGAYLPAAEARLLDAA